MTITTKQNGNEATIELTGRLDTVTAPDLEKEIQGLSSSKKLVLDFSSLDYISSAGLRVLLSAHKDFSKKDGMTICNVNETILDIFDVTGFKDVLNIQ